MSWTSRRWSSSANSVKVRLGVWWCELCSKTAAARFCVSSRAYTSTAGSYGKVSLYKWKPGATALINGELLPQSGLVAVKSLLPTVAGNQTAIEDFKAEMSILSRLSHSCLGASNVLA